jgi:hypothetical protein
MSTDAQTLLSQAKCYVCLGITIGEALQLALLAQIVNGGSSSGFQQAYTSGDSNPNTAHIVPANTTIANWWYQDPGAGGILNVWYWSVVNQSWSQYSG